jgi:hypothetical protein
MIPYQRAAVWLLKSLGFDRWHHLAPVVTSTSSCEPPIIGPSPIVDFLLTRHRKDLETLLMVNVIGSCRPIRMQGLMKRKDPFFTPKLQ